MPSRLRNYRKGLLRGDTLGALTACALIVPESVACAQIAGVPPQNAFYAAPVALLVYALFERSNFLIIGATSAAAVLSAAAVSGISGDPGDAVGLSAALAVIVGVVLPVAGVARLGFITNFLAEPALVGFLFGRALTIVVRQGAGLVARHTRRRSAWTSSARSPRTSRFRIWPGRRRRPGDDRGRPQ